MPDLDPDAAFQDFLAKGRFMIQRSRSSGAHVFYPRVAAPGTGAADLEWVEASGDATVYSVTIVGTRPPAEPYNVTLVDLAEGPRLMTRIVGVANEEIRIGMAVKATIEPLDGRPALVFRPAGAGV